MAATASALVTIKPSAAKELMFHPVVGSAIAVTAVIALWSVASFHSLIASPVSATRSIYEGFADGSLLPDLLWTLQAASQGFVIAAAVGIVVGLVLGLIAPLRRVLADFVYGFSAIPKLIFYPIILGIFSLGFTSNVVFIALVGVCPVLLNTMASVQEVLPIWIKVGRSFKAGILQMAFKIYLPAIASSLVIGLRLSLSQCLLAAVLAETLSGQHGLGYQAWTAYNRLDLPWLYGIVSLIMLVSIVASVPLWYVERRLRGRLAMVWSF